MMRKEKMSETAYGFRIAKNGLGKYYVQQDKSEYDFYSKYNYLHGCGSEADALLDIEWYTPETPASWQDVSKPLRTKRSAEKLIKKFIRNETRIKNSKLRVPIESCIY
jgi:hypothetical protein